MISHADVLPLPLVCCLCVVAGVLPCQPEPSQRCPALSLRHCASCGIKLAATASWRPQRVRLRREKPSLQARSLDSDGFASKDAEGGAKCSSAPEYCKL